MSNELLLSTAGFIILTSFSIIAYLWKEIRVKNKQDTDAFSRATTNLRETAVELRATITHMKSNCTDKHSIVDKRLDSHAAQLKSHGTKIAVIESKLNKS